MWNLDNLVARYQKKIGTYDKQPWEMSVEQRIISGLSRESLRNTKLQTDLIDVDLVRGSSFPKAKPKQSFLTVIRLAILRLFFMPVYAKWWIRQTSPNQFAFLLFLYMLQMFSWAIYMYNTQQTEQGADSGHIVSISELLIPLSLSLILSGIHSQIVATSSIASADHPNRKTQTNSRRNKRRERLKRKRRSKDRRLTSLTIDPVESNRKSKIDLYKKRSVFDRSDSNIERSDSSFISKSNLNVCFDIDRNQSTHITDDGLRRRIVQFNLSTQTEPIDGSLNVDPTINQELNLNIDLNQNRNDIDGNENDREPVPVVIGGDDDGFESFNGKSSSSDDNEIELPRIQIQQINDIPTVSGVQPNRTTEDSKSESDTDTIKEIRLSCHSIKSPSTATNQNDSSEVDDCPDDEDDHRTISSPDHFTDQTTSGTEWLGITTNSDECSYESESQCDESDINNYDFTPTVILNPSSGNVDRISCTIWDGRQTKKAEMSVLEISSAIIRRVEVMSETCDYIYIGLALSTIISLVPAFCRVCDSVDMNSTSETVNFMDIPTMIYETTAMSGGSFLGYAFGRVGWERTVLIIGFISRICLTFLFFFLLTIAERTFKQRFLYAKLFSHLTSSRRAQSSDVPHFRLNKVRNIKTWLSVRSYLKRRGPQRSVDVIVSTSFILTLLLLAFLSVEWLKDSVRLHSQLNLEALAWACGIGCFLLRFMTLGTKINRKYRSISVLITEQINLYLQIEQKPNKKDELTVANSVLKLAADLIKELESPFKISGLSANPYLYTTVKVVILSALSGVLSEMLGFKLKLHKIKIK